MALRRWMCLSDGIKLSYVIVGSRHAPPWMKLGVCVCVSLDGAGLDDVCVRTIGSLEFT
jgi:hypothetical protein